MRTVSGRQAARRSPWVQGGCAISMLALAGLGALCSGLGTLSRWADDPGATALALVLSTVIAAPYLLVLLWVDRHEPEPWWLVLSALAWGAIGASGLSAIGNDTFGLLLQVGGASEGVAGFLTASLSAPFVEESAKGLALLALLALFRRELHGVIDGILYGALIGLGFEWLENLWYYVKVSDDGPLAMIRLACMRGCSARPAPTLRGPRSRARASAGGAPTPRGRCAGLSCRWRSGSRWAVTSCGTASPGSSSEM
jgi:hypothetical protein